MLTQANTISSLSSKPRLSRNKLSISQTKIGLIQVKANTS